jgi:uncharacterized protein YkwD
MLACAAPALAAPRMTSALKKRLRALQALESARADALTLIRDEGRYVKGDKESQREVDRKTQAVEAAFRPVDALLRADAKRALRKRKVREALLAAPESSLNPWERQVRARVQDMIVLAENDTAVKALPRRARPSSFQMEQLRLTNEYRMLMGLQALRFVQELTTAAQGHSDEMAKLGYFDHTSPTTGRETPFKRADLAGFDGSAVGENIADGYRSPRDVHRGWLRSAGHHRNIVDPDWEAMGVAFQGELWAQVFGRLSELES